MQGSLGGHHAGKLHRDVAEVWADRILAEELARHGWDKSELLKRRKNDAIKLEIAARLRRETTLSIKEIAARVSAWHFEGSECELAPAYEQIRDFSSECVSGTPRAMKENAMRCERALAEAGWVKNEVGFRRWS